MAKILREKGISVVISNHDTEFTRELYSDAVIQGFDVQRFISSKTENRKKAAEMLAVFA
jgi:DNA adenine methylase